MTSYKMMITCGDTTDSWVVLRRKTTTTTTTTQEVSKGSSSSINKKIRNNSTNEKKIIYGQAFVIYALVEYHRATGSREPLDRAMDLYRVLQRKSHDRKFGGWVEHFTREWQPILDRNSPAEVEVCGLKSANSTRLPSPGRPMPTRSPQSKPG